MMSSRPWRTSSAFNSGTSVRCAAASDETPRMCTSFSTAWRAASAGGANRGPILAPKPTAAKADAITLSPRSCAALPDLGNKQARAASFRRLKAFDQLAHPFDGADHADLPLVDTGDCFDLGAVTSVHLLQRRRNLPDGRLGSRGISRQGQ